MKIAFFAAVRYHSIISGRTKQLALELAELGHDVWFVEMPSVRNSRLPPFRTARCGKVQVVTLPPFPGSYALMSSWVGKAWRTAAGAFLHHALGSLEKVHGIVSNPWWTPLLTRLSFKTLSYDCIDHISVHCGATHVEQMRAWEHSLLAACHHIFIINPRLKEELKDIGEKNIHLIPNGVPDAWLKLSPVVKPHDRPRTGFIGAIYEWVDQEFIVHAADVLTDMDFVLIGPTRRQVPVDRVLAVGNIRLLPPVSFERVPEQIAGMDVCLIPFKQDIVSECADPLKLYEYLALGKPVVSSVNFNSTAPIYYGLTREAFVQSIRKAFSEKDLDQEKRRSFAAGYSWRSQAEKMVTSLS